jgi:hypothetical protein
MALPQGAGTAAADDTSADTSASSTSAAASSGLPSGKPQVTERRTRSATVVPGSGRAIAATQSAAAASPVTEQSLRPRTGLPASPITDVFEGALQLVRRTFSPSLASPAPASPAPAAPLPEATAPTITLHNNSDQTIWVYNLATSGNYQIPADFQPVSIAPQSSSPVTLAVGTGALGSPENRIYIVEGTAGIALPVDSPGGIDAFNPKALTAGNSFLNYNFLEYYLYPANGGYQYTIDTSYIDEWSLPVQYKFTLNGANWSGAVDGKTYGFKDFDTVVAQLKAAGGPYSDLVWSGSTPWTPHPPSTVSRIIGPDKVWAQQSGQVPPNQNMNQSGWVPTSYQNFVQYGASGTTYPYAWNGTQYSATGNFDFWMNSVDGPASTPYPMALRLAAIQDGFPADSNGVYGFFTYPNDETAGQFTNIPTAVSLDIYVNGSGDGLTDSVIDGGAWVYASPPGSSARAGDRGPLVGTGATDSFILNRVFADGRGKSNLPSLTASRAERDIVVIDSAALGATSTHIDYVEKAQFKGPANYTSQFVYETSTGNLYYDNDPTRRGYSGILANLKGSSIDPTTGMFVL